MSKFPHQVVVQLTDEQYRHLGRITEMAGASRAAVVRQFVQDSLDKANDVYVAIPSADALRLAYANTNKET